MQHQLSQSTCSAILSTQCRMHSISVLFVGCMVATISIVVGVTCPINLYSQAPLVLENREQKVAPNGETHVRLGTFNANAITAVYLNLSGGQRLYGTVLSTSPVISVVSLAIERSVSFPPQLVTTSGTVSMENASGTGTSFFSVTVTAASPVPFIAQMSIIATSPTVQSFPLSIQGANFFGTSASIAILNSAGVTVSSIALPVISSSGTVLTVQVPAGAVQTSGQVTVTVANIGGNIASTTLTISAATTSSTAIPTVGEWAMIILALSLFCVAVMYVRKPSLAIRGEHIGSPVQYPIENMKQNMMLSKEDFVFNAKRFFPLSFTVTACVWSVCVYFHETTIRDMVGTGLAGIAGGYLLMLLVLWTIEEK